MSRDELQRALEAKIRYLSMLLYDTNAPARQVDEEISPYLAPTVRFVDPWQEASGRDKYRLGAAGFHAMFRFDFVPEQVSVQLSNDERSARALLDGVMYLRLLAPLMTYPLRTILVYELGAIDPETAHFEIRSHEEMWSIGDMLAAAPVGGWLYRRLFRRSFAWGFLAASWVSSRLVNRGA